VICSGGPLALKASQIARADLGWSLSLTSVLLGLNVITVPVWSGLLLGRSLSVSPGSLVALLGVTIIAPYVIGTTLRALAPSIARVWWPRIAWTSNVILILAIVSGLAAHGVDLISTGIPLVLVTALAMVLAAGLLARAAPEDTRRRRATILGGINRATSIGLLVADRAFPGQPEVLIAAIAFGLVQTSVALGLAFYWRSTSPIPVAAELGITG
jgi:predicted Na+-dependent transporter